MSSRPRPVGRGKPRRTWPLNERAAEFEAPDWADYRQCPQCFAVTGQPCVSLDGYVGDLPIRHDMVWAHSGRQKRTGR